MVNKGAIIGASIAVIVGIVLVLGAAVVITLGVGLGVGLQPKCSVPLVSNQDSQSVLICFDDGQYPADQNSTEAFRVTLHGNSFQIYKGVGPNITIDDRFSVAINSSVCPSFPSSNNCTEITFDVPSSEFPTGMESSVSIRIASPTPPCNQEKFVSTIAASIVRANITSISNSRFCLGSSSQTLDIAGLGFFMFNDSTSITTPTVSIGNYDFPIQSDDMDQCNPLFYSEQLLSCDKFSITIPPSSSIKGAFLIDVSNPAPFDSFGCNFKSSLDTKPNEMYQLVISRLPETTSLLPVDHKFCIDDEYNVTLIGPEFFRLDGQTGPVVTIAGQEIDYDPSTDMSGCVQIVPGQIERCTAINMLLFESMGLEGSALTVSVVNPAPFDCAVDASFTVLISKRPVIEQAPVQAFCVADSYPLVLSGYNLMYLADENQGPTITIDGKTIPVSPSNMSSCIPLQENVYNCTDLIAYVPESAGLFGLSLNAFANNPDPLSCPGSEALFVFSVLPKPTVSSFEPSAVCSTPDGTFNSLTIRGANFISVENADGSISQPSVTIDGQAVPISTIFGCSQVSGSIAAYPGASYLLCDVIVVDVQNFNPNTGSGSSYTVVLTQPAPFTTCPVTYYIDRVTDPNPTTVSPATICTDLQTFQTFSLWGTNFALDTNIAIRDSHGAMYDALEVQFFNDTYLEFTISSEIASGYLDVFSWTLGVCQQSLNNVILANPLLMAYSFAPSVLVQGSALTATLLTSGLQSTADQINLIDSNGKSASLSFSASPSSFNEMMVSLPSNLSAGNYSIEILAATGCRGFYSNALNVLASQDFSISSVSPSMVGYGQAQEVKITSQSSFLSTASVYLNPSGGSTIGISLISVTVLDASNLIGFVPISTPVGVYDVMVTNVDGSIGIAIAALNVTSLTLPKITSVQPSVFTTTATDADIFGSNFHTGFISVFFTCGTQAVVNATISSSSSNNVNITFDFSARVGDTQCTLTLTNTDDGSFTTFDGIFLANPSFSSMSAWTNDSHVLTNTRLDFSLAAGYPMPSSPYIYTIGGRRTSGSNQGLSSIERSRVNPDGSLAGWSLNPVSLQTSNRNGATVTIGEYIFLVGGRESGGTTSNFYWAQVLSPLVAPIVKVTSVSLVSNNGNNPQDGAWVYYAVSAVYNNGYAYNPGGESLPSETVTVYLPQLRQNNYAFQISLDWANVPDAISYNIYRGTSMSNLKLLDQVGSSSYVDDGNMNPNGNSPLSLGSLGNWYDSGVQLNTQREYLAAAAAPQPGTTNAFYIYAFGGLSGGNYYNDYERIKITFSSQMNATSQTPAKFTSSGSWTGGAQNMPAARAYFNALSANAVNLVGNVGTNIYIGPGKNSNGNLVSNFETSLLAATVGSNGDLGTFTTMNGQGQAVRSGCLDQSGGTLFYYAGTLYNGTVTNYTFQADLSQPYNAFGIGSWTTSSNFGNPRTEFGCVSVGTTVYAVGGLDQNSASLTWAQYLKK